MKWDLYKQLPAESKEEYLFRWKRENQLIDLGGLLTLTICFKTLFLCLVLGTFYIIKFVDEEQGLQLLDKCFMVLNIEMSTFFLYLLVGTILYFLRMYQEYRFVKKYEVRRG